MTKVSCHAFCKKRKSHASILWPLNMGVSLHSVMSEYFTSDLEHPLSDDDVRTADRETQIDVLKTWFRKRFEDPAERTPYESAEGGYIWIWGGPYDAQEELGSEFGGLVPDDVIEEVVSDLEQECVEWAPTPSSRDYDEQLYDDISNITDFYDHFAGAILDVEKLLETKVDASVESHFYRLLYVNVITALETYLGDAFINTVASDKDLMRRFVETTPDFKNQKVPLADVYKALDGLNDKARGYLLDVVWHHLPRAENMYRDTLGISFLPNSQDLHLAIRARHDIVHRNGKTKEGKDIDVLASDVKILIENVETFVQHIDSQFAVIRAKQEIEF